MATVGVVPSPSPRSRPLYEHPLLATDDLGVAEGENIAGPRLRLDLKKPMTTFLLQRRRYPPLPIGISLSEDPARPSQRPRPPPARPVSPDGCRSRREFRRPTRSKFSRRPRAPESWRRGERRPCWCEQCTWPLRLKGRRSNRKDDIQYGGRETKRVVLQQRYRS